MKFLLLIASATVLVGCSMDNREIVEEVAYCQSHGLDVEIRHNDFGRVVAVQCMLKERQ